MSSEPLPNPAPAAPKSQPFQAWLERLGLSGKLLAIGGAVGLIAVFLPLLTMSMSMPTLGVGSKGTVSFSGVSTSQSLLVVRDWRGFLCLAGYLAALAFSYVLYPPTGLVQKTLGWAGAGVGAFVTLLALWLVISASSGSGMGFFGFQVSLGFGAIVNLLAAGAVAAGGFLKAREEKLL